MLCPAKINLGLTVHHRRPADGYHYISSIFIPIDFGDELNVAVAASASAADRFTTANELPPEIRADFEAVSERAAATAGQSNLVWRALAATRHLRDTALDVHLIKRVPTGGGLGGGSSDAGTLLAWIRDHYGISNDTLAPIAAGVGSDVPFFLYGRPALIHGTGDIIEPIPIGAGYGVLCFPMLKIETGIAYSYLKRTLQPAPPPRILSGLHTGLRNSLAQSDWSAVRSLENDFEAPVFAMFPSLGQVKQAFFEHGASFASLSGSGSSLYGLVASDREQQRVLERMRSQFKDFRFQAFRFGGSMLKDQDPAS